MTDFTQDKIDEMTEQARTMLQDDGALELIGNFGEQNEILAALVEAFPEAKQNRTENPAYGFADFVSEFSTKVTGKIITAALQNTRGALANRYEKNRFE